MQTSKWCLAAVLLGATSTSACGDDDANGAGGAGNGSSSGGAGGSSSEQCVASYVVLQKDAYKDTAGKSGALWPPHTTTVLTVSCSDDGGASFAEVDAAFQANHGTEPGAVDASGQVILVEMKKTDLSGSREELVQLLDAYRACTCEGATAFLSLDALQDEAVTDLIESLVGYLSEHLVCAGETDTAELIALLQEGMIDEVLAVLPSCSWDPGTDLNGGLDEALQAVLDQVRETLAGYHVCNNDAALQSELVAGFAAGGGVTPCDATSPLCSGPMWFYEP